MTDILARLTTSLADRYVIERELGAGGMATVYLAHDVRHDRKVALKVLRPELSAILGGERFLKEIRTTANLQHPHILQLFDSGEADGTVFYVMPFVAGESLRDRLSREKQLPVDDAVRIAKEVASALDYAHRHDVVHRDIKPENILLHDGTALVADFGIALAASRSDGGTRMTETGMSLGTPHYMSPEQAMGQREITPKADIYALGCVLYEMLTGEPPFTGPTAQAIIARVMTEQPRSLTLQRHTIPPHVEAVVSKALEKLPADRFGSAADFGSALANATFTTVARPAGPLAPRAGLRALFNPLTIVTTVLAVVFGVTALVLARPAPPSRVSRFRVMLDTLQPLYFTGQTNPPRVDVAPDGDELVYVGASATNGPAALGNLGSGVLGSGNAAMVLGGLGSNVLVHRRFSELTARELPGTQGAWVPQYAPDGERVAFVVNQNGRLAARVIALSGGPPVTVLDSGLGSSVAWGPDDHLYYVRTGEPEVWRVPAGGGAPALVARLEGAPGITYHWPAVLPGGRGILVTANAGMTSGAATGTLSVRVYDLATGEMKVSLAGTFARYAPTGHLIYSTLDQALLAVPFDSRTLAVIGRPVTVLDGLDVRNQGITDVSLSPSGTLAYTTRSLNAPETVSWVTRDGSASRVDPGWTRDWEFEGVALSPDGRRVAVVIETSNRGDVWVKQLDRGPLTRLTFAGDYNAAPTWTPDGRYVTYVSLGQGRDGVWRKAADGSGADSQLVATPRGRLIHYAEWSRDSRWLVMSLGGSSDDVYALQPGVDSLPRPILAESFNEFFPALSPDGRWLAYVSDESGRNEIYLRPFPDVATGKWQLTTIGGIEPVWAPGGRELYFRSLDRTMVMAVDLSRGAGSATERTVVRLPAADDFEGNPRNRLFDVAPTGRFLMVQRSNATDVSGDLVVVLNWFTELRARVGR